MIIDTHAHYNDSAFDEDRNALLEKLPQRNVSHVVDLGCDLESSIKSVKISNNFNYIYSAIGVHPECVDKVSEDKYYLRKIEEISANKKVLAIGEIGLDFHYKNFDKKLQKKIFEEQLELAQDKKLPVLVHARDSLDDLFDVLNKYRLTGIVHCFSGNLYQAQKLIDINFKLGVGGVITFKNAENLRYVVKNLNLSNLMLETDAPYLAPLPFRGKRCDSSMIEYVSKKISEIKEINIEDIYKVMKRNFNNLFKVCS